MSAATATIGLHSAIAEARLANFINNQAVADNLHAAANIEFARERRENRERRMKEEEATWNDLYRLITTKAPLSKIRPFAQQNPDQIIEELGADGKTAFYEALLNDRVDLVKLFLKLVPGAATMKIRPTGEYPLTEALARCGTDGNLEIVKALLDAAPGVASTVNEEGLTPVMVVCSGFISRACVESVRWFASMFPKTLRVHAKDGSTIVHRACIRAPADLLEFCISSYPDAVRIRDNKGNLPIHTSCKSVLSSSENLPLLIDSFPGSVRCQNKSGQTPIHLAPSKFSFVKELVDVDPGCLKVKDREGRLALHMASIKYHPSSAWNDDVFYLMVAKYPQALDTKDVHGKLPVNYTCNQYNKLWDLYKLDRSLFHNVKKLKKEADRANKKKFGPRIGPISVGGIRMKQLSRSVALDGLLKFMTSNL